MALGSKSTVIGNAKAMKNLNCPDRLPATLIIGRANWNILDNEFRAFVGIILTFILFSEFGICNLIRKCFPFSLDVDRADSDARASGKSVVIDCGR